MGVILPGEGRSLGSLFSFHQHPKWRSPTTAVCVRVPDSPMVSIDTMVWVAALSFGNVERLPLTTTQWKNGVVPHYRWVGVEVQTFHMVSTITTRGRWSLLIADGDESLGFLFDCLWYHPMAVLGHLITVSWEYMTRLPNQSLSA